MTLIIAHHLPDGIVRQLEPKLPEGVALAGTPQKPDHWQVPGEATAMILLPPHGGVYYPPEKPAGWPFGLRWVQAVSTGVDDYPKWVWEVESATCGRGTQSNAIAEFAVASILALEKRFPEVWIDQGDDWHQMQNNPLGTIEGKTVGIIGFGTIGQAIARRAAPFGANVLATSRSGTLPAGSAAQFATLDDVLAQSDHLVLAAPLTPETRGMMHRAAFARMKKDAHFVNIARGQMVDQDALLEALNNGHLRMATLDVTDPEPLPNGHPFYSHPKVRLTPHMSWGKGGNPFDAIGGLIVENIRRFQNGQVLLNPIDRNAGY
ncbi:NAD(P)-dependent oxidoreductase [Emcibacter sp. SYSU 3D8]|uniref:NAD(P)-dependent oxidoreductase n=1 Tax=Emcibacter sp. SYSU 3D8 TaxID=3133969 RepID=UPI0031FE66BC